VESSRFRNLRVLNSSRLKALGIGASCVVLLLILASAVSNGSNARAVAANARSLHWVNSVLGSAALARAANAQALVFAVDFDLGVASVAARHTATHEARVAAEYLEGAVAFRPADSAEIGTGLERLVDDFVSVNRQVLEEIELGRTPLAVQLSQGPFEVSYQELERNLVQEQAQILQAINETESALGRAASVANILVTLLIPAAAITIYFLFARRQLRERRLAMELQLEAAHELSRVKDEFIGSLSHELRTPLTSIYGFSDYLLDSGVVESEPAKELITIINTQSSELMRMVEDLLTGARLDSSALTFDITDLPVEREIEAVSEPFRRAGLDITVSSSTAMVRADQLRFRQVVRNLLSNAQRHGGPRVAVGTQIAGDELILAVIDNGPGVPSEIESRLFERFVHDGRRAVLTGSVGLGLAIARTLTEAMGGRLEYERIEGHTVFRLTLPLAAEIEQPAVAAWNGPDR
jgi:signal transduction histidine kinase